MGETRPNSLCSIDARLCKKSGRVSAAAGFVGELLGLKPIITFENGDSVILEKVRGEKAVVPRLVEMMQQNIIPETPYSIVHGMQPQLTGELAAELEKEIWKSCLHISAGSGGCH